MGVKAFIMYGLYPLLLWQVKIQSVNLISVFINKRFWSLPVAQVISFSYKIVGCF